MTAANKRKSLDYYLALRYPITIEASPEGGYFVQIKDLPGCYSQGETVKEAHEMIEEARRQWLECAYENDCDIPVPRESRKKYSGKFVIRAPESLHRALDEKAREEGVSLNLFLVSTLSKAVGMRQAQEAQKKGRRMPPP